MANLDLNRYIDRIRAQPGQNFLAIALKETQDFVNQLATPTATSAAIKPTLALGGASLVTSTSSTSSAASLSSSSSASSGNSRSASSPSQLQINGVGISTPVNFNSISLAAPNGTVPVEWQINNNVTPPTVNAFYVSPISLNIVAFNATPVFDASLGLVQEITLTGNVTSFTIINATRGQPLTLVWLQDSLGNHSVSSPPASLRGFTAPGTTASTYSAQSFVFDGTNWIATSSGVQNV